MPRTKKAKADAPAEGQTYMPGCEPERNEAIYPVALAYRKVMRARVKASKAESDAKDALIEAMVSEGVSAYHDPDGWFVTMNEKKNVRIQDEERGASNGEAE